jgi:acyl dehydratase
MPRFTDLDDLLRHDELGTADWLLVDQDRIDGFARITGDHQWIHTDPERARTHGPFGTTIAHGALTLSLCMTFLTDIVQVGTATFAVNGGFDRVRFHTPVRCGSRLRGKVRLREARRLPGGARLILRVTAEIEGERRPACVADHILALYEQTPEHTPD